MYIYIYMDILYCVAPMRKRTRTKTNKLTMVIDMSLDYVVKDHGLLRYKTVYHSVVCCSMVQGIVWPYCVFYRGMQRLIPPGDLHTSCAHSGTFDSAYDVVCMCHRPEHAFHLCCADIR